MSETGGRIAELRKDLGYKQKDIADMLGIAISTVSNYETGCHEPDLNTLCRLADFFHVSTDYLLGRTDFATNPSSLSKNLAPQTTCADILEMLEQFTEEECAYLIETIRLLYYRHRIEKERTKF